MTMLTTSTATSEYYIETAAARLETSLEETRNRIGSSLRKGVGIENAQKAAAEASNSTLTAPLEEALMRIRIGDVAPVPQDERGTLATFMDRSQTVLAAEKRTLKKSWEEWQNCQNEIAAIGFGLKAGRSAPDGIHGTSSTDNASTTPKKTVYKNERAALMKQYYAKRDKIMADYDDVANALSDKLEAAEEVYLHHLGVMV